MTDRMPGVGETINLAGVDYRLEELIAVQWNPSLAAEFPDASHEGCRQVMERRDNGWHPCVPTRCIGYHCPRCGEGTGSFGHNDCTPSLRGTGEQPHD